MLIWNITTFAILRQRRFVMKLKFLILLLFLSTHALAGEWHLEELVYRDTSIRMGYLEASEDVPFKGNILYFQGFADSMLNHDDYFNELTKKGYRVISFDYPGQGGSGGSLNSFRVNQLKRTGRLVWNKLARKEKPKRIVIGWSTGGLIAYRLGVEKWADALILLAPSIYPKKIVGKWGKVTKETLVGERNINNRVVRNEVDGIRPSSPLAVPIFATNLIYSAHRLSSQYIDKSVKGMVYITDRNDHYVKGGKKLKKHFFQKAGHFDRIHMYGAYHEIDKEGDHYRLHLYRTTTQFLDKL